jgi:haloacid dehalogenase-like hydrolase
MTSPVESGNTQDLGLEFNIIFNKGSVMVLPTGVNKGSGLAAALHKMQLSLHNTIGIGDAENDHAFLELCECSVAVGNALPAVKDRCDLVMASANGRGVAELISMLLVGNFFPEHSIARPTVTLGTGFIDDHPVNLALGEQNILFCGSSGGGKSTTATVLEQLMEQHYQCVLISPEGDYEMPREVVTFRQLE